jgi:adenosylcobinamide-GDP ribazoletransferase
MSEAQAETSATTPAWPGWLAATAICIRFYSRLPVPRLPGETDIHALPDFRMIPRALPLAALVIALPAALTLLLGGLVDLSPALAATLAVTVLVLTTGGLHEDGLADSADGLFGGHSPERRLEIMKDSRIGAYGALALGLSLLLRVTALAAILEAAGGWAAGAALLSAAICSRTGGIAILTVLPPARRDGAAAAVGRPEPGSVWLALALAGGLAAALTFATALPLAGLVVGLGIGALGLAGVIRLARALIGGQTGDIVGAGQQTAEIAVYLGFAFMLGTGPS